ncbi:serine-repeat antigen (SERA), putative [Plasmodium vivax]|uniref:Serine-repeat antigen (SERA), putative n=1 Tax=Plasmodium vivax (strain Salvador I) TaxID=126793 RepID=A5KBM3_PLAVS|nr:serine-repeat antigen (SERA), putative [Plasmodium vivax]EDL43273.1 serine-repeat antigen (SERA), putative [Plasmodium vivax]|eukprot:XP_001613000.1 serine-repeat antigen (SERA) [Plasmodium vivax Sal-1]
MKARLSLILILCVVCRDCAVRCTGTTEAQGAVEGAKGPKPGAEEAGANVGEAGTGGPGGPGADGGTEAGARAEEGEGAGTEAEPEAEPEAEAEPARGPEPEPEAGGEGINRDAAGNQREGQLEAPSDSARPGAIPQVAPRDTVETSSDAADSSSPDQNPLPGADNTKVGNAATPPEGAKEETQVKSSLLKGHKGVKVTGPCGASFLVFFAPYLFIDVDTDSSNVYLGTDLSDLEVTEKMGIQDNGKNKCEDKKTFKFVALIGEDHLTIKWKVYDPAVKTPTPNEKVEMRKYVMKNLSGEFTAVQVHTVIQQNGSNVFESKNYALSSGIPEKCDAVATNCFLSGSVYIEKCYRCTLKMKKVDPSDVCYNYIPKVESAASQEAIPAKASDEESSQEELTASIGKILQGVYKKGENGLNEVLTFNEADAALKAELLNYCSLMKKVDASGVLGHYQLGSEEDVHANLTNMLQTNSDHVLSSLQNKLKNPAICLKNADEWVGSKTGLLLPNLFYNHLEGSTPSTSNVTHVDDSSEDVQSGGYDGVIDFATAGKTNFSTSQYADKMHCNAEYCDRAKDAGSCVAKMEVQDQGDCANSWLFASKVHLETIKCVKGYDHVGASALYVANCSGKEANDKCHSPSNPLEFLNTLEETNFLPADSDLPYSYKQVGNACPEPKGHWQNLWENVKLLGPTNEPNSMSTKGYTAYQSDHFKGNMDSFIKLVKSEVMKKGSVIAYVKVAGALSYDLNGKKVLSLCGSETPDLAVNIVGYGNYISAEGVKKPYWLLQNSWGKHWGDKGTFKVDMNGPPGCHHNFIHTAAVFNLDMPVEENPQKEDAQIYNYYLKSSPDFWGNIYYKNVGGQESASSKNATEGAHESVLHGQEVAEAAVNGAGGEPAPSHSGAVQGEREGTANGQGPEGVPPLPAKQEVTEASNGEATGLGAVNPSGEEQPGPPGPPGTSGLAEQPGPEGPSGEVGSTGSVGQPGQPGSSGTPRSEGQTGPSGTSGSSAAQGQSGSSGTPGSDGPSGHTGPSSTPVQEAPLSKAPGTDSPPVAPEAAVLGSEVTHVLKYIKKNKVKLNLVTYKNHEALSSGHDCWRSYSANPDKYEECVKLCEANWSKCENDAAPGFCLYEHAKEEDCFFCYV